MNDILPGDPVLIRADSKARFAGQTGVVVERLPHARWPYTVEFDLTGERWFFKARELEAL